MLLMVTDGSDCLGTRTNMRKFSFPRNMEVKIEDAYHILMKQGRLGLMVTFAAKKEFGAGADLLANHARWEIAGDLRPTEWRVRRGVT